MLTLTNIAAAEALISFCGKKNITLGTAESCTGGLIGGTLTAVSGSSSVVLGGIISYANSVKSGVLGVPEETLATVGAVSPETAKAMAEGARRVLASDLAVAVTGIAGPGGGSAEKPVGLVYVAVATKDGTEITKNIFDGDRNSVREKTVAKALAMLTAAAEKLDLKA